jgi:hypothetical protein
MCGEARSAMKLLADHLPGLCHFGSLFVTDFQESSACISETVEKRTPPRFSNGHTRVRRAEYGNEFSGAIRPV